MSIFLLKIDSAVVVSVYTISESAITLPSALGPFCKERPQPLRLPYRCRPRRHISKAMSRQKQQTATTRSAVR
jgi:hypothetical protein